MIPLLLVKYRVEHGPPGTNQFDAQNESCNGLRVMGWFML